MQSIKVNYQNEIRRTQISEDFGCAQLNESVKGLFSELKGQDFSLEFIDANGNAIIVDESFKLELIGKSECLKLTVVPNAKLANLVDNKVGIESSEVVNDIKGHLGFCPRGPPSHSFGMRGPPGPPHHLFEKRSPFVFGRLPPYFRMNTPNDLNDCDPIHCQIREDGHFGKHPHGPPPPHMRREDGLFGSNHAPPIHLIGEFASHSHRGHYHHHFNEKGSQLKGHHTNEDGPHGFNPRGPPPHLFNAEGPHGFGPRGPPPHFKLESNQDEFGFHMPFHYFEKDRRHGRSKSPCDRHKFMQESDRQRSISPNNHHLNRDHVRGHHHRGHHGHGPQMIFEDGPHGPGSCCPPHLREVSHQFGPRGPLHFMREDFEDIDSHRRHRFHHNHHHMIGGRGCHGHHHRHYRGRSFSPQKDDFNFINSQLNQVQLGEVC